MEKKEKIESLLISVMIPVFAGVLAGALTRNSQITYQNLQKPSFSPPAFLFPIVWTILYVLMGVSYYIIRESKSAQTTRAKQVYFIQLLINFFWSFIFFNMGKYLAAFLWISLLLIAVVAMIREFYKINKVAAYLQIPYLLWIIFASILNFAVYLLNR